MAKFKVVTLCGSTRFKEEFSKVQAELTLNGIIVISLGLFSQSEGVAPLSDEMETLLIQMHQQRIDLADEIFVINKGGYIGNNTQMEIQYARKKGKRVTYLEPVDE